MPAPQKWSELSGGYRHLTAIVGIALRAVDGAYECPSFPGRVEFFQEYTPKRLPKRFSWRAMLPHSELLQRHTGERFHVTLDLGTGICRGMAFLPRYNVPQVEAELEGIGELEGLYEAGWCVPEVQDPTQRGC